MDSITILKKTRALLSDKKAWCRGAAARDKDGMVVFTTQRDAVSFCLIGAFYKVEDNINRIREATTFVAKAIKTENIAFWNDRKHRKHEQVLKALDKAIALAEKEA